MGGVPYYGNEVWGPPRRKSSVQRCRGKCPATGEMVCWVVRNAAGVTDRGPKPSRRGNPRPRDQTVCKWGEAFRKMGGSSG